MLGAEQLLRSLAGQLLDHIGKLTSAVVALAWISLRIFVCEDRASGFKHSLADKVLGGDQFQAFVLATGFVVDGGSDLRINFVERAGHG